MPWSSWGCRLVQFASKRGVGVKEVSLAIDKQFLLTLREDQELVFGTSVYRATIW